jgi:hypothetical protein
VTTVVESIPVPALIEIEGIRYRVVFEWLRIASHFKTHISLVQVPLNVHLPDPERS